MRFGAALDLWHKGELHVDEDTPEADAVTVDDYDPQPDRDRLKTALTNQTDIGVLRKFWVQRNVTATFAKLPPPMQGELTKDYTDMVNKLTPAPELDGDKIPY